MNSIKINYDKEELEIDGEKITKPFIVKVPYDDGYQRAKVFNHKNGWKAGEKLPCISIQEGENVKENTDELIDKLADNIVSEVLNETGTKENEQECLSERIENAVGLQEWRNWTTGELIVDGKLFTGESAKRATQIVKALDGLTIREAQDLLERVNIHLLNSVVTTDR